MSADVPPPFEDVHQSSAPDTSADTEQSHTAPAANGSSFKDSVVDSEVSGVDLLLLLSSLLTLYLRRQFNLSPSTSSNLSLDTAAAMNTVSNHPVTQNAKETLTNGTAEVRICTPELADCIQGLLLNLSRMRLLKPATSSLVLPTPAFSLATLRQMGRP